MNRSLGRNWLRVQIETWYVIEIGNVSLKVLLVFFLLFDRYPESFFHFGSSRFFPVRVFLKYGSTHTVILEYFNMKE